ncbi:methionyl-tRNA formyltransferase [Gorillibacterium massiliense]|uniref:methionyl-tRNA formyltransferase n=1 Tax=Gorillibacterium massiliense TaxID=1280390 RepID=UPI0004B284F4|nr:methionyl-tRNA formyltransferase [Gorillibacterium massiliense]
MNILFMGTPDYAVPSLRKLLDSGYRVVAVVTQPDRPKGRKRVLTPTPVKVEAEKHGIPVLQPERIRRPEAVAQIAELAPDLIVTAAYGQILPKAVLDLPKYGCINVHGSLLPKYRGGAPIQYAVINGESVTGVTIMYMAEGIDTGDMLAKVEVPITDGDTAGTLFDKLSLEGAELLGRILPDLLAGKLTAEPQQDAEATHAPTLKRADELIDWSKPSLEIFNRVRGLNPWPVAYSLWNGEVLKVWACAKPDSASADHADAVFNGKQPGTVLKAGTEGITVRTGDGSITLTEVQPAGKKAMSAAEFSRGKGMEPGTVLGV